MTNIPSFIPIDFDPFQEGKEIEKITFTNDSQREIWLSCIIGGEEANLAYNESVSLDFDGQLDYNAFKKAVDEVILRHEALRSTVSPNGEMLIIYKKFPVPFELDDISYLTLANQKAYIQEFLNRELGTPLNLKEGPLFRVFLHKLNTDQYYFTLIKHHVIGDGWSTGIILEDLSKIYSAYTKGIDVLLSRAFQISDYVIAQDRFKLTDAYKATEDYWLNQYKDHIPVVDFPTDHPRTSPRTYNGCRIDYSLSVELVNQLKNIGAKAGTSLVTTLLSAYEIFIYLKTNQKDIVVGLPASGQAVSGMYDLVGHCVNLLPLKSKISPKQSFVSYLKKRKSEVLDAYDHQQLTFGELIKKLYIPRDSSRITLVPVIFNVDMGMDQAVTFEGLKHKLISNPRVHENFEIYLNATGSRDGIVLEWSYNTGLFEHSTIEQYHQDYISILETIAENPETVIADFKGKKDYAAHLIDHTSVQYPVYQSLNELVYQAAAAYPQHTALTFENSSLTYKALNQKSNQIAHFLITKGIRVDDKIALCVDRSIEMILALVGIVKTGSAYVPIDMGYPQERIKFVLQNSAAKYLIVSRKYAEQYAGISDKLIVIDELITASETYPDTDLAVQTDKNTLVYILHTSGSTGVPKGVCMGQQALVNLLLWQKEHSLATAETKTLQFSPLSFDVSFQEIFATLSRGGNLILIPDEYRMDPFKLLDVLNEQQVNRIFLPFVALQSITETAVASGAYPSSLKEVMTAGEQLKITPQIVEFFSNTPEAILYNQYGPTEAHVVTELRLSGDPTQWPALPNIGRAIANTRILILDEDLDELPDGTVGELCISGLCLAEGYLNLPEMTAEKFVDMPGTGMRIYKTGDLARFLPDGNIEFLGRRDHQVKIRGYRIELGEIEAHLNKQKGVKQAVVHAQEDLCGNKKLIAYLIANEADLVKEESISWHTRWDSIYNSGISSEKRALDSNAENLDEHILKQLTNSDGYREQAQDWVSTTSQRIKEIGARSILEIGCGGGNLIRELAPTVEKYFATDYSDVAINYIKEKIKANPEKWANVSTAVSDADNFSAITGISPDLVLINSVIQYFPNVKYLFRVIEQAAKMMQKGCIFIGDVQERATLEMHHAGEQLLHSPDELSIAEFVTRINRRMEIEDELMVDPQFFFFIQTRIPEITHVEVQLRKGNYQNETTKYHYDVWLSVNSSIPTNEPDHVWDWNKFNDLDQLKQKLSGLGSETIIVKHIPNQRTIHDYQLVRLLKQISGSFDVADLKRRLESLPKTTAFDPNAFWEVGQAMGFQANVRWSDNGLNGDFEVVFAPKDKAFSALVKPTAISVENISIDHFEAPIRVLSDDQHPELINLWRNNLKDILPDYMVPNDFLILNKLPLTLTGKIDRKALPTVSDFWSPRDEQTFIAPRTAAERLIANIWTEVLHIKSISVNSDFFELGGHSLIAVKVMVAIEKETGKRLPLASLFENPTIESLSKMIAKDEEEIKWDSLVTIKKSGTKMPIYMIHGGGLNVLVFHPLAKYMDKDQPIYGMQALGLNGKSKLLYSMEELADHYNAEILNNDPVGPYALAGYSFGGLLAYEMAKRLLEMGKEVKMLGILDTFAGGRDLNQGKLNKISKKIIRQFKKVVFFGRLFIDDPKETINYQIIVLKRKIRRLFNSKPIVYDSVFSYDDEIHQSYDIAWNKYMMQPLDIRVDLFRTKKRIYFLDDLDYLGWRAYARKGVDVHDVPGDHKTFLFAPHDKEFAEILQKVLDSRD
jgi:amino acid adenylation domain-containing protein